MEYVFRIEGEEEPVPALAIRAGWRLVLTGYDHEAQLVEMVFRPSSVGEAPTVKETHHG